MNKFELISKISEKTDLKKKEVTACLDTMFKVIIKELACGGDVRILDFGTFKTVSVCARKVKNPRTGTEMNIPAGRRAKFSPSKAFKEAVKK